MQDPYERNSPGLGRRPRPGAHADAVERRPNAGFCPPDVEPWLPLGDVASVEAQRDDPRSMLSLYRALLALRRELGGAYRTFAWRRDFAYLRDDMLVALNLSGEPQTVPLGELAGRVRLSTHLDGRADEVRGDVPLRADEGLVICLCNA